MDKILTNKAIGCLIGGAAGDALGYQVEFIFSYRNIEKKYGTGGISEYDRKWHGVTEPKALFSDDTQMTLYTAEGLLRAIELGLPVIPALTEAYLCWMGPQLGMEIEARYDSRLAKITELNQNRAPGNTCLSSLHTIAMGGQPHNDSKGCGGIMRIAPIAIYGAAHGWTLAQTAQMAADAAHITHLHPSSDMSSACCAAILHMCLTTPGAVSASDFEGIVKRAMECTRQLFPQKPHIDEFEALIGKALSYKDSDVVDWQVIETELGGGWVADETLAIAVYSVIRNIHDFKGCMVCAVNHGGDSDSTGAVAGNILGAILGIDAIPASFRDDLQLTDLIEQTAINLLA